MLRLASHLTFLLFAVFVIPSRVHAQLLPDPLSKKDQRHAAKGEAKVAMLSRRLMIGKDSTAAKVEAIYDWVTHHIHYDRRAYRKGILLSTDPYATLRRRKALAGGYAVLVEALCREAGIPAATVLGHAKGIAFRPGQRFYRGEHAWNAIQIKGEWRLLDATWGSYPTVYKKQPLREFAFVHFRIPYARRYKTVHRPSREWLSVDPSEMVVTHLPIDPKWQLLDSAVRLAAFEAVRDTAIPPIAIDYSSEIAEGIGEDLPRRAWIDGQNAKRFNGRDDFDLAYAHVLLGHEALAQTPEQGGDTLTWTKGIAEMNAARKLLVDWKRKVGGEHRKRMSELRKLEIVAARAISHARGEVKFVQADFKKLDAYQARINDLVNRETFSINKTEGKIRQLDRRLDEIPDPIRDHVKAKFEAQLQAVKDKANTLSDTVQAQCRTMHTTMSRIYAVGDSIERTRLEIAARVEAITPILMANAELPYLWASDSLDKIATTTRPNRRSRIQQSARFWATWRGNSGRSMQAMNQYQAGHRIIRTMYTKGLPEDSAWAKLLELNYRFDRWKEKRLVQLNIPLMQMDLEVDHVTVSQQMLAWTPRTLAHQSRLLSQYLRKERKRQTIRFHTEMQLATHVQQRAEIGAKTMRTWIAEARAKAQQLARR